MSVASRVAPFSLKGLKKYWELIPLVSFLGCAVAGGTSYAIYSLIQKPDVTVDRREGITMPYDRVNPEKPQKLLTFNTKYEKIPELEKLRKEIGSYKY